MFLSVLRGLKKDATTKKMIPESGKLSTTKTEVNVERVRKMVHSDRRLAVHLIANGHESG